MENMEKQTRLKMAGIALLPVTYRAVVLKLFSESIILIQMKIQSIKKLNFEKKVQKIC